MTMTTFRNRIRVAPLICLIIALTTTIISYAVGFHATKPALSSRYSIGVIGNGRFIVTFSRINTWFADFVKYDKAEVSLMEEPIEIVNSAEFDEYDLISGGSYDKLWHIHYIGFPWRAVFISHSDEKSRRVRVSWLITTLNIVTVYCICFGVWVIAKFVRRGNNSDNLCPACRYEWFGLNVCPECGNSRIKCDPS